MVEQVGQRTDEHWVGLVEELRAECERLRAAAKPFAEHDWCDADLEDDNCQLVKHGGKITVGHWRALRAAIAKADPDAGLPTAKDVRGILKAESK